MTRLAYLSADPGVPAFGTKGASVHVQEILRAFRLRGATPTLYTVRTDDHVPADLADVPVVHLPVDGDRSDRALPPPGGAAGAGRPPPGCPGHQRRCRRRL